MANIVVALLVDAYIPTLIESRALLTLTETLYEASDKITISNLNKLLED